MPKISREPLSVSPNAVSPDDANNSAEPISHVTLLRVGQIATLLLAVLAAGKAEAGGAGDDDEEDDGSKKRTTVIKGEEEPCPPELLGGGGASKVRRGSIALGRPATKCFPLPKNPKGRALRPFLNEPVAPGTPGSFAPLDNPVRFALGEAGCQKAFVELPGKSLEFQVTGPVETFIWIYPVFDPTALNMRIRISLDGEVMKDDEAIVSPDAKAILEVPFEEKRKLSRPIQVPVTIPEGTHTLMVNTERFGKGGVLVPNSAIVAIELPETAAIPPSLPDYGEPKFPERPDRFLAAIKVIPAPLGLGGFEVIWLMERDSRTPPDIAYGYKYNTPGKLEVREIIGKPGIVLVRVYSTRKTPLDQGMRTFVPEDVFYQAEVRVSELEDAGYNVAFLRMKPMAFSDEGAKGPDEIEADIVFDYAGRVVVLPKGPRLPPGVDFNCSLTPVEPDLPETALVRGDTSRKLLTCVTPPGRPQSVFTKVLPGAYKFLSGVDCVSDLIQLAEEDEDDGKFEELDPASGNIPDSCKEKDKFVPWRVKITRRPSARESDRRGKK